MYLEELEKLIEDLSTYFQKPKPKKEAGHLWFEEVRAIPGEAIQYIYKKIISSRYPENIPKTLWAFYYAWLEENPNKKAHQEGPRHPDPNHWTNYPTDKIKQIPEFKIGKALLTGKGWDAIGDSFKPGYE